LISYVVAKRGKYEPFVVNGRENHTP